MRLRWWWLWRRLANNRGQLTLPNMGQVGSTLTQFLPSIGSYLTNLTSNPTTTGLPRLAEQAGGMALLGYAMRPQRDIDAPSIYDLRSPYGTSSANYLQGVFQAPPDPFAAGGLYSKYLPALQQAETDLFNNTQQSIIAGLPQSLSTAMGGSELAAIRDAFLTRALPQRQALMADLMRETLNRQLGAAGTLYGGESNLQQRAFQGEIQAAMMNAASETERNKYLAQLGAALILAGKGTGGATGVPGLPGTGAQPGAGGQNPITQYLTNLFRGGGLSQAMGLSGANANPQLAATIANQVSSALGMPIGGFTDIGNGALGVLDESGNLVASVGANGQIINQTTGQVIGSATVADFGLPGAGLLGPAGTGSMAAWLSSLGSAAAGGGLGYLLGSNLPPGEGIGALPTNATWESGLGGAAGGAAAGFAVGGPIGAVIGGISGLVGGLFGQHEASQLYKAQRHAADVASVENNAAVQGSFWLNALGATGYDTDSFANFAKNIALNTQIDASGKVDNYYYHSIPGETSGGADLISYYGAQILLKQLAPKGITSLDQIPGFRQGYMDYLLQNYRIEQGGQVTSTTNPVAFQSAIANAFYPLGHIDTQSYPVYGLQKGGRLPVGGEFLVGERGPELLRAAPGTEVLPMRAGPDGSFFFDPTVTARSVVPPGIYLPNLSRVFESPPVNPMQALMANPQVLSQVPLLLQGLGTARGYPGTPQPVPPLFQPRPQPTVGRPAFAQRPAARLGPPGRSLLARGLNPSRRQPRRNPYAPAA